MASVPSSPKLVSSQDRERRQHPRCRVVDRNLISVDLGRERRGILVDVSLGGASVQPYDVLELGEVSRLRFTLPGDSRQFDAEGVIRWANTSGRAGIEFLDSSGTTQFLSSWIDSFNQGAAGLPTQASPHASAAYLPPSFSPWLRTKAPAEARVDELENEIASLDLVSALRLVCDRARSSTQASGAAIAIADGAEIVCRAHSGVAPELGARFKPDSGLSGEAVRTAATVLCADTSDDPRVDRHACQNLNVRSVLIVPILTDGAAIGVIEVFSAKPNAFEPWQLAEVQRFSQLVAAMLEGAPDTKNGL